MNPPDADYVTTVMAHYVKMPETPLRVCFSDQGLARRFYREGIPLEIIETALLLGSLRRLIRPAEAPRLEPIRSLAYFRPVIEELLHHPVSETYGQYLRLKLQQVTKRLPANCTKIYAS
jgi:hypothetical protein